MVFYFTATGNCLFVARELAADEGCEPVSIPKEMARDGSLAYEDDAIGIVYPVYGHMMPQMVRRFIERATFLTPYFYLVATYGNRKASSAELGYRAARASGVAPSYVATLLMADNWLPGFDMDDQRASVPAKRIDENLGRIRADVAARRHWIEPVTSEERAQHEQFLSRGLRFEADRLVDFLEVDAQACTGCGVCAKVCPANCVSLSDGVAVRDALAGDGCNACLACIHACPSRAIVLPGGEVNPEARFRNEHVTLRDLIEANGRVG